MSAALRFAPRHPPPASPAGGGMNVFLGTYWEVLTVAHRQVGIDLAIIEDKPTSERVRDLAGELGIPLETLSAGRKLDTLFPGRADLVVVGSFGRLLRRPVLARSGLIVNFHPGIVEICRGRHTLPVNARRGEVMMGITCHLIEDEAIDAGPIIAQIRLPIDYDDNFDVNHTRLRRFLAPLAEGVLAEYREDGTLTALPWTPDPESYHPPLSPEELRAVLDAPRLADVAPLRKRGIPA